MLRLAELNHLLKVLWVRCSYIVSTNIQLDSGGNYVLANF